MKRKLVSGLRKTLGDEKVNALRSLIKGTRGTENKAPSAAPKATGHESATIDVSVIIPVYRCEEYIEQAIRSITDHTDCRYEIIAVDDESPDDSVTLINKLQAEFPTIRLLSHPNMGGARTLNRGLGEASGRYVMFLDGDDWVTPHALDILLERADGDGSKIAMGVIERWSDGTLNDVLDTRPVVTSQILTTANGKNESHIIYENSFYTGSIFNRKFLLEKDLWFPDLIYADRPFAVTARAIAEQVSITSLTVAIWRKRDDPENLSITDQTYDPKVFQQKVVSYLETYDRLLVRGLTAEAYQSFRTVIPRMFWNLNKLLSHEHTTELARIIQPSVWAMGDVASDPMLSLRQRLILNQVGFYAPEYAYAYIARLDRVIAESGNDDKDALSQNMRDVENVGNYVKPFSAVDWPKDPELIVFENNFGRSFGGMPMRLLKTLRSTKRVFKAVWVYSSDRKSPPRIKNVIFVKRGSPEYYAALSRARYWVTNIKIASPYKPKDTIFLQTWHGTPLKRLGLDIALSGPEVEARDDLLAQAQTWDYLISPNPYSTEIFRRAFNFEGEILETGYPSNDPLVPAQIAKIAPAVRLRLGIPEGRKVVLYAPTWRDNQRIGTSWNFRFRLQLDLHRLQARFGKTHFFLIRMHHLSSKALPPDAFAEFEGFARNVSNAPDTTELLSVADILITDYSSIFFDFAVTRRPMIFYMYDRASYVGQMRDFYFDPDKTLPGPIVSNENELISALQTEPFATYADRYENFSETFNSLEDGLAGHRVANAVFNDLRQLPKSKSDKQFAYSPKTGASS